MAMINGVYFTKNDDKRIREFLELQGLTEKQTKAVLIHFQEKQSATINLTSAISSIAGLGIGLFIGLKFM